MLHIREKKKANIMRKKERKNRGSDNAIHQMLIVCFTKIGRKDKKKK